MILKIIKKTISYSESDNFQGIIKETNICLKEHPNYANLYNNRANAYKNLKKYDEAIKDYDKAIELDNTYPSAYANRGEIYILNC